MTVVALDGPTASGKSTVARAVATELGYVYVDTGAMYRAIGLLAMEAGVSLDDAESVVAVARGAGLRFDAEGRLFVGRRDVSAPIRTQDAASAASRVSAIPEVRRLLVEQQRALAGDSDIVMEGRDIGTNVFPEAQVKVFLSARPDVRSARRAAELRDRGQDVEVSEVLVALLERDRRDSTRKVAPLRKAADAVEIDTSELTLDEVIRAVLSLIDEKAGVRG